MELIKEARRFQKLAGILTEQPEDQQPEEETPSADTPEEPSGPISKAEAIKMIKDTKGKFFTVTFIKRTDGSVRVMNARLGVKAYLKGGVLPYDPATKNLIPVFDIPKKEYRMINLDTITKLKIGSKEYDVK
jgi:hypothetical protein